MILIIYLCLCFFSLTISHYSPLILLQNQLDAVASYSNKWGLKINVNITKICIFEKRKSNHNFVWKINDEIVEVVHKFKYLGVSFSYNGSMKHAVNVLNQQTLRAFNHLLSLFYRVKMGVKTKLTMFNTLVVPILLYCLDVWGVYNHKDIDNYI